MLSSVKYDTLNLINSKNIRNHKRYFKNHKINIKTIPKLKCTKEHKHAYTRSDTADSPIKPKELIEYDIINYDVTMTRKTKIVCTIGPSTCTKENLFALADAGMDIARLNMSHGDYKSHKAIVDLINEYNSLQKKAIAIMLDTKGPEVRSGDLYKPLEMKKGEIYIFTITEGENGQNGRISVNYDGFIDDVSVNDILLVDGGLISFLIKSKDDKDVTVEVLEGGMMASRRHLNIRGKSANLPSVTEKDWQDLKFGLDVGIDFYALSFIKNAEVIYEVKKWLSKQNSTIGILGKIESAESIDNLDEILDAVDGAMVARGDLGAELPLEQVPYFQSKIIQGCRRRGKPVIVATNMLESMIKHAAPTRAEVSDISIAVREGSDAVMLSGETAYGLFPFKAVNVMSTVAERTEASMKGYSGSRRFGSTEAPPIDWVVIPGQQRTNINMSPYLSEMFAYHATTMANTMKTSLVVFTRHGNMPALLSHYRPDYPIYALTDDQRILKRLCLYHGITSIYMKFPNTVEQAFEMAIDILIKRNYVKEGQMVAFVQSGRRPIWRSVSTHSIQVRKVLEKGKMTDSVDEEPFVDLQAYLNR